VQASLADNRLQSTLAGPKFNSRTTNSNNPIRNRYKGQSFTPERPTIDSPT